MNDFKKHAPIFFGLFFLLIFFALLMTQTGAYILGSFFRATFSRTSHSGYSESTIIITEIVKAGMAGDEKAVALKKLELAELYLKSNLFNESKEILDSIKVEFLDDPPRKRVEQLREVLHDGLGEKVNQTKANGFGKGYEGSQV